jgi:hypothetical protein
MWSSSVGSATCLSSSAIFHGLITMAFSGCSADLGLAVMQGLHSSTSQLNLSRFHTLDTP